ncbi:MAG: hypothetical protein M1826_007467 [Phylliscum demangeonii]|nr:MAG: hypothetical protein M1826_007467 [Phylliscum demangeonii]
MEVESANETADEPTPDQDELAELAPVEAVMADDGETVHSENEGSRKGVLLDDHHYFSDEAEDNPKPARRLPKGTSAYQAAWLLDDDTDSDSDSSEEIDRDGDYIMDPVGGPTDHGGVLGQFDMEADNSDAPSECLPSEMFLDPAPEDELGELAAFRSRKRTDAQDDLEFPDEIELRPEVLARERLARYRGLRSLKSSVWDTGADRAYEPEDWNRLLRVANYKGTKSRVTHEALKHTVVNMSITLDRDLQGTIKSKDELILQCGSRRLVIHPLFSQPGQTVNNVHKFERFLHAGHTAVATFVGPVTWGSVPVLFFRRRRSSESSSLDLDLVLVGRGTTLPPDPSRVIAKRIILTGHPYKVHKNVVTVRYMFFNAEDIKWFKALKLWTRRGRTGFIKESLGTHGYFKATFDGKINPQDAVCISLYKRLFPRPAAAFAAA